MAGIYDHTVRRELLEEKELTLQKQVEICRVHDVTTQQAKTMGVGGEIPHVKQHGSHNGTKRQTDNHFVQTEKRRCVYCGAEHPTGKNTVLRIEIFLKYKNARSATVTIILQKFAGRATTSRTPNTHMPRTLQQWNQDSGSFGYGVRLVIMDVIGLHTNIPHQDLQHTAPGPLHTNIPHQDLFTPTYPTRTSSHQHTPPGPPYTNIPHQDLLTPTYPTRTSSHQHTAPGPPHTNISHQDLLTPTYRTRTSSRHSGSISTDAPD